MGVNKVNLTGTIFFKDIKSFLISSYVAHFVQLISNPNMKARDEITLVLFDRDIFRRVVGFSYDERSFTFDRERNFC